MGIKSQLKNKLQTSLKRKKASSCFWLIFSFLFLISTSYSQPGGYESTIPEGATLSSVLDDLGQRYELDFAYDNALLDVRFPNSEINTNGNLEEFLEEVFDQVGILFYISGNNKILLKYDQIPGEDPSQFELTIKGKVIDKNGQSLPFVSVTAEAFGISILSDEKGEFVISVPRDTEQAISFIFLGYQQRLILLSDLKNNPVVILQQKEFQLREVTILSTPRKLEPRLIDHSLEIDAELLKTLKASGLSGVDLFRNIQLLPGVSAIDDTDASIKIRGGNGDETLIILDGIPIFNSNHFFGIFSSINPEYINSLQLFKNAMPVEYGGKTGGLLLLHSSPLPNKAGADLEINLLTASANLQIPAGKKSGFLLGARTSYNNVNRGLFSTPLNNQSIIDIPSGGPGQQLVNSNPDFRFHDLNFRFLSSPTQNFSLDANFFYSFDDFNNTYETRFRSDLLTGQLFNEATYAHLSNWENIGTSLNFEQILKTKWTISGNCHFSRYNIEESIKSTLAQVPPNDSTFISVSNGKFNQVSQVGGTLKVVYKDGQKRKLSIGLSANRISSTIELNEDGGLFFVSSNSGTDSRLFLSYKELVADRFSIEAGGRLLYYSETSRPYFSPQLLFTFLATNEFSLKSAISRNHQFSRALYLENRLGESRELFILSDGDNFPAGHSTNFMAGLTLKHSAFSLDIEAYHKIMSGIMEIALLTNGFENSFSGPTANGNYHLFAGTGTSTGIDFLLGIERQHYSGWLAYTLSKTINCFPEIRMNSPFAAQNDRRHQFKWINNIHLGKFDINANYIFSSGRPYTDIANLVPSQDRRDMRSSERQSRLPAYHRLDIGLDYSFNIGKMKAFTGVSVFNLTNRANVSYYQFIYNLPNAENGNSGSRNNTVVGTETDMLGRTLNLSFRLHY